MFSASQDYLKPFSREIWLSMVVNSSGLYFSTIMGYKYCYSNLTTMYFFPMEKMSKQPLINTFFKQILYKL